MALLKAAIPARPSLRPGSRKPWSITTGYRMALVVPVIMIGTFFLIPLSMVVIESFASPHGTLDTYTTVWKNTVNRDTILYTFIVAIAVTLGALLLGYPTALLVSRARGRTLLILSALILIPFYTSTVVRTYAWVLLLQRNGVINGILVESQIIDQPLQLLGSRIGLILAMIHIMLPMMILPLLSSMRSIDSRLMDASSILGARPIRQFITVFFPLSVPGIVAGSSLVFITSLGFYVTPALLSTRRPMIAILIEQQANLLLDWPLASALATVLLAITGCCFAVYVLLVRMGIVRNPARGVNL